MSIARMEEQRFQLAGFGPESRLPDLNNVAYVHSQVHWDDTLSADDTRWMKYGRVSSILPYLEQNGYGREKKAVGGVSALDGRPALVPPGGGKGTAQPQSRHSALQSGPAERLVQRRRGMERIPSGP